jgi:predicted alpha-1,6-mannanase (GH76 family)
MNFLNLRSKLILLIFLVSVCVGSTVAQSSEQAPSNVTVETSPQRAGMAVKSLQKWYDLQSGLYKTTGWWNAANVITVLADYSKAVQSQDYDFVFSNTLSAAEKKFPGFINEYYDDEGWWALAWIDAYQQTNDPRYLEAAEFIFKDMTYGWDNACSGGIWWSKDRKYKNAIANELFLSVAAELANEIQNPEQRRGYLGWADKEWTWFSHSGMINKSHLVNDGLNGNCENNGRAIWTYNQGVLLGGLAALSKIDRNPSLLRTANGIAQATISTMTDSQGILHEACEPHCGADGTQFKGVFVRNLRMLDRADPGKTAYKSFIQTNADSIWSQAQAPDFHLGEVWAAPFGATDASTQSSALDVLVAAIYAPSKR